METKFTLYPRRSHPSTNILVITHKLDLGNRVKITEPFKLTDAYEIPKASSIRILYEQTLVDS